MIEFKSFRRSKINKFARESFALHELYIFHTPKLIDLYKLLLSDSRHGNF